MHSVCRIRSDSQFKSLGSPPQLSPGIQASSTLRIDHYGQASCNAGRAACVTGQYPIRVGLASVGLPGAEQGMNKMDPTIKAMHRSGV